jgi:Polyketide cyclase / dehydrase and lipid transport
LDSEEETMASVHKEITTKAHPDAVWDAIRDIGALHTRLVPGFVVDTQLVPGARVVTFANGMVATEPIVDLNEAARRLVWSAQGGQLTHYNASVQVFAGPGKESRVVWIADFLPHEAVAMVEPMMTQGMAAMQRALDALA